MAFLLDTDWAIYALNGELKTGQTLRRLRGAQVAVSIVTVAELYDGAFSSPNPEAKLTRTRHFPSSYRHLAIDDAVAETFAEVRSMLRRLGQLIPDFDLVIASTALVYDLTVLTFNTRHFQRITDLKLYEISE